MAIKINTTLPTGRFVPPSSNYTTGAIKDSTTPTAKDGSPLLAVTYNDLQGFTDALLDAGGVTHSGTADTAVNSQRLNALLNVIPLTNINNKATIAEAVAGTVNKFPDSAGVKSAINATGWGVENYPDIVSADMKAVNKTGYEFHVNPIGDTPVSTSSAWHLLTWGSNGGSNQVKMLAPQATDRYFMLNGSTRDYVELYHSGNFDPSLKVDNTTFNARIPKKDVQLYNTTGNVSVNFSTARKHIVTRRGAANGTITLSGTMLQGDVLIIENVQDNSGVATITGKTMFTGIGTESATTHTLTGQGVVTMTCYDGTNLSVRGVY